MLFQKIMLEKQVKVTKKDLKKKFIVYEEIKKKLQKVHIEQNHTKTKINEEKIKSK